MLGSDQRRSAIFLIGLMLIGMMLETLGVGLILPVLSLMINGNLTSDYPFLAPWISYLGNPSQEKLVVFAMMALTLVAIIKVLFLIFLTWRQANFTLRTSTDFSLRLFTLYLRQPYAFHLQRNSAKLIRNTIGQVGGLLGAVASCMMITAESLILLGILTLMLIVEPMGTLWIATTFGLTSWVFYRFTKERLNRWGEEYQHHDGLRIQYLQEGLGAAKEIKLMGCEKEFIDRYNIRNLGTAQIIRKETILRALPRFWMELLAVSGISLIVIIMIAQNRPMDSLVSTLGLFAAAAFRIMPSANRLLSAAQNVRFSWPTVNNLHKEFTLLNESKLQEDSSPLSFKEKLVLEDISFRYPSTEKLTLEEISLSISKGDSVGFIGSTGAGKSTLLDIILGLHTPFSGVVKVDDVDIQTKLRGWQNNIGYVPQFIFLTDDTLRRNVAFGLTDDKIEDATIWSSLRDAQLEQFVQDLPEGLDTWIGESGVRLSGGQRQRIGIARALYHNPSVLVLDEATSSLDTATETDLIETVCALKGSKTLIIIAHRLSTVENCDYLFKIENGRIVEEGKTELILGERKS